MNEKDDIILEFLHNTGVAAPPSVVHFNIKQRGADWESLRTTRRRLQNLRDYALVEIVNEQGRYYQITEDGVGYLKGCLDASDLET